MFKSKKFLVLLILLAFVTPSTYAAEYKTVECSTDTVFSENSCNQCFTGGNKLQGDNLGLLSDLWVNATEVTKVFWKEEQTDPEMINLSPSNVTWTQTPSSEGFWEYTEDFEALYDENYEGYVLNPGKSVTWIKSAVSSAYKLEKNTAPEGENIGLLVFPIITHNILEDGEIVDSEHKECVLFKSGEAATEGIIEEPKKLPETGPAEFMLLAILAMILGFGLLKFRARS